MDPVSLGMEVLPGWEVVAWADLGDGLMHIAATSTQWGTIVGMGVGEQNALAALRQNIINVCPSSAPRVAGAAEKVDHPAHYGGAGDPYEVIKVIEAWKLGFHLGNTLKYIGRRGKKGDEIEDLEKARWYLDREIEILKRARQNGGGDDQ